MRVGLVHATTNVVALSLYGAALVQRWGLAGTAAGTPEAGKMAALLALIFLFLIGLLYRERKTGLAPEYQTGLE